MKNTSYILIIFYLLIQTSAFSQKSHSVYNLSCEQETSPLNIEKSIPKFSWQTNSTQRNYIQSAWQIIVTDTPEKLDSQKGNIWDSGNVRSDKSILIPYGGKDLVSSKEYYWKVRT